MDTHQSNPFKPTRAELRRVQYLADECEIDMRATATLAAKGQRTWYGLTRPGQRSAEAFELSRAVAARSQS